jgi:hypothetical protein
MKHGPRVRPAPNKGARSQRRRRPLFSATPGEIRPSNLPKHKHHSSSTTLLAPPGSLQPHRQLPQHHHVTVWVPAGSSPSRDGACLTLAAPLSMAESLSVVQAGVLVASPATRPASHAMPDDEGDGRLWVLGVERSRT